MRAEPVRPAEPEVLPRTPSLGDLLEEITEERAAIVFLFLLFSGFVS